MQHIYSHPISDSLKDFIHSIWIVRNGMHGIRSADVTLYPLGYPYISIKSGRQNTFQFKSKEYRYNTVLAAQTVTPSFFQFSLDMDAVFIRLQPWALYNFTGSISSHFFQEFWNLEIIGNDLESELMEIINKESTAEIKGGLVEKALSKSLKSTRLDERVIHAIEYIKNEYGIIKIEKLADKVNLSIRRLQQLFETYIGLSPKKLAAIYRLHKIIHDLMLKKYPSSSYQYHFDQAHFINDFKKMTHMSFQEYKDSIYTSQEVGATLHLNLYT